MRKTKIKLVTYFLVLPLTLAAYYGCTDASRDKLGGYGDRFKVELVNCDGTVTHSWISSGKVLSEGNSDGYYFNDASGKLIEVTGTLIITKL